MSIGSRSSKFTRRVVVTGNTCLDNGRDGWGGDKPQTSAGITIANAQWVTVSGNVLGGERAGSQRFGLVQRNSTYVKETTNDFGSGLRQHTLDISSQDSRTRSSA